MIDLLRHIGNVTVFTCKIVVSFVRIYKYLKETLLQLANIGYFSVSIVALTALFTGAVLVIQSYNSFGVFNSEGVIAKVVALSIAREIGPVLVGLIMTGRISGSIAAEIGSMRVTEQLDAMKTLTVNPLDYLIAPKVIAGIVSFPLALIIADTIGIYSGYLVAIHKFHLNESLYIKYTFDFIKLNDVMIGLIKSTMFGAIATIMSCYYGYNCSNGARGVGKAATQSVVSSFVLILLTNYIVTSLVFQ